MENHGMGLESGIDMQALERLRILGGNELVSKMVQLFITHAESSMREAEICLAAGNLKRVQHAAHSLKSSAGNLGAQHVQDLAGQIELLSENKTGELQPLLAELEQAYLRAKGRLTEEIREV
jgi:HPt (histidine-containing phosphotransfer) domain-containing protein